jgi:hypothetical protein
MDTPTIVLITHGEYKIKRVGYDVAGSSMVGVSEVHDVDEVEVLADL